MSRSTKLDAVSVAGDAAWLPQRIDVDRGAVDFVHLARAGRRNLGLIDSRYIPADAERATFDIDAVDAAAPAAVEPLRLIFHSAFCGSTLLARSLDLPGVASTLAEPQVVTDLAARAASDPAHTEPALRLALRLLARPFAAGERVVVKFHNRVNGLIDRVLEACPTAPALLVYRPLPDYLLAVARGGPARRAWVRRLAAALSPRHLEGLGLEPSAPAMLTDLRAAALVWLLEQRRFGRVLATRPTVAAIDGNAFLAEPARVLPRVASHFGLALSDADAAQIVAGPDFARYAKEPARPFAADEQATRTALLALALKPDLADAAEWATALAERHRVPLALAPRLA